MAALLVKSYDNKIILGICSGIAEHFVIPPVCIRILFLCIIPFGCLSLISYLALWFLMPQATTPALKQCNDFYRSRNNSILGGICGSLSKIFAIEAIWIRLVCILLAFFSAGWVLLIYAGTWFITSLEPKSEHEWLL